MLIIIAGPLGSFAHFMEPEAPFTCPQDPATSLYPESDESCSNSFFLNRNALSCKLRLGLQSDFIISALNTITCRRFRSVTCVLHVLTPSLWFSRLSIISGSAQTMKFFILMRRVSYLWCVKIHRQSKRGSPHSCSFDEALLINYSQWKNRMLENLKQNARLNLNNI
jgi:hypothetical protein